MFPGKKSGKHIQMPAVLVRIPARLVTKKMPARLLVNNHFFIDILKERIPGDQEIRLFEINIFYTLLEHQLP